MPYICCLQETHLKTGDTYRLKVKGWKKIFHTNGDQKKAGVEKFDDHFVLNSKEKLSSNGIINEL